MDITIYVLCALFGALAGYIERYAKGVKQRFSKYWDAIYNISEQLKSLKPSRDYLRKNQYSDYVFECNKIGINPKSFNEWVYGEKQKYKISGKVHGCIKKLQICKIIVKYSKG